MQLISKAGRIQILNALLHPPVYNEEGELVGYGEPLITVEEAKKLLELDTEDEDPNQGILNATK